MPPTARWRSRKEAIIDALAKHNYAIGANLSIQSRFAEGTPEKLRMLTEELVGDRVDVIIAHGDLAANAAKDGSERIPIVAFSVGDPVGTGLVLRASRGLVAISPALRTSVRSFPPNASNCLSRRFPG